MFYHKDNLVKRINAYNKNFHQRNCADEKMCTVQKVNCAFVNLCKVQKLHFKNNLRCRFAHFVHDGFSHICRFAHLCFVHVQKFANMFCVCAESFEHVKMFSRMCARLWIHVFHVFHGICKFERFLPKCRKSRNFRKCPENVRKKLTCSWVVHEWFLAQRVWQHRVAKVARICIN